MNSEKLTAITFILLLMIVPGSVATMDILTQDGLKLTLSGDGTPLGTAINGISLPMLAAQGGFSFREALTSGPNLLANPGFERGTNKPLNWTFITTNGNIPVWDNISHSGSKSIKISISGTVGGVSGYPKSDLISVEPLQNYMLSAWVKTYGTGGTYGPSVRVVELDADKNWLQQTSIEFSKGTNDWTWKQISFRTSVNTRWVYVYANIWDGYGTFWVDDVALQGTPNLLLNPGFERGVSMPLNWSFVTANGNNPIWDDKISYSGKRSIRLIVSGTVDSVSGYPKSDLIKAEPFQYYTFSAWAKAYAAGGTYPPGIRVVELDANQKWLRQTDLIFSKGTYNWTQKQVTFQTGTNTSYLYVYANIWNGYGTFWVDDMELEPIFSSTVYLRGTLTKNADGTVTQKARANDIDFTFYYKPKGRSIELQGEIQDLRGTDRALQVMYNLPVNAQGWWWGDYIRGSRVINWSTHYENIYKIGDIRKQSTYPFASIDNSKQGLSIAMPMDIPRVYRTGYNLGNGYSIQYDFGLSKQTLKIGPGHANFTFTIFKADEPEWGFRGTAKKYYELYPKLFQKTLNKEGTLIWADPYIIPSNIKNASDFGLAYDAINFYLNSSKPKHKSDVTNGIYTFQYTEPWGVWMDFGNTPSKPSFEERMALLNDDLINGGSKTWNGVYDAPIVPLNSAARAVMNSAPYDENGKMYLDASKYFWDYWGGSWVQNYPTNPDPDIPSPNRFNLSYKKYTTSSTVEGLLNWNFGEDALWYPNISHSGNYSAEIAIKGNDTSKISGSWESDEIAVKPKISYVFSAWGKTKDVGGVNYPAVKIVEFNADGTRNYSSQRNLEFNFGTNNWMQRSLVFTTSGTTTKVFIYSNMRNSYGTFWFDDVKLYAGDNVNLVQNNGIEPFQAPVNGIYMDSLFSDYKWGTLENYRVYHWRFVDIPLVFSYNTKKPVILGALSQYEYIDAMNKDLHRKNQFLGANILNNAYSYYSHLLDITGNEVWNTVESDKQSSYRRTMSYQKTNTNILQWYNGVIQEAEMENYIKYSTFYAIFPSIDHYADEGSDKYFDNKTVYERDRPIFRKYIPIIKEISKAGWEPIPYATIDNKNLYLERYGDINKNNLYYTIYNPQSSQSKGLLSIDITKLGLLSGNFSIKELVYNKSNTMGDKSGKLYQEINMSSNSVLVYKIEHI